MSIDIVVPTLGESITEATVAKWMKAVGDAVKADDPLVELETDKVTLEVYAPAAGTLSEIRAAAGATVVVGAVLGGIGEAAAAAPGKVETAQRAAAAQPAPAAAPPPRPAAAPSAVHAEPHPTAGPPSSGHVETPDHAAHPTEAAEAAEAPVAAPAAPRAGQPPLSPAVRKLVEERGVEPAQIAGTGKGGRLTKGDVLAHLERPAAPAAEAAAPEKTEARAQVPTAPRPAGAREERVRMSRLRQRIAERLKQAQNTAAILTTFNEVDMSAVMALRSAHKEAFEKRHGVRLGIMSFFVKASIAALKEYPAVNGEIDGTDIVYKNHYDIGVAVGTEQGLVVPVVRDADLMSFAEIEKAIASLGKRARDGKLTIEELTGGTFTITNGGVYGSLLSTPIINPPQSGILGMHKTQNRPVAVGEKVEVRPMMYIALSYDHRIVDGREAVSFLVRVKESLENPERLLLDL
jgi:2-oxoglutarate dehydrogenase E2 component (dihydrolipoamide succinyltransferase)